MEVVFLLIGLVAGGVIGVLIGRFVLNNSGGQAVSDTDATQQIQDLEKQAGKDRDQIQALETEVAVLNQKQTDFDDLKASRQSLVEQTSRLDADVKVLETKLEAERKHSEEKQRLLEKNRELLVNELNKFMHENNEKISEQHKSRLAVLLEPLQKDIKEFQKTFIDRSGQQSEQVKSLAKLNQQLSEDASNLTKALKGEAKTQGNWGEIVLERILEVSGLEKDREYFIQESFKNDDGRTVFPDVVVRLPANRDVIIDSKVTLVHFEQYSSAEDEDGRAQMLKQHLRAVREHIKNLASKKYDELKELHSLDQVVMFMPVEGAYVLTLKEEPGILEEAQKAGIMLVCPSTLMLVLHIINHMWRQEDQSRNAMEIAEKAGNMYDKFVGFLDNMSRIGSKLESAQKEYDQALNKLKSGTGNLIKRAEDLKELGVKAKKTIPSELKEPVEIEVELEATE